MGMGGRVGGTISDSILGGGTKHFYLLILYNFKNIGGARAPPPGPPTPRSLVRRTRANRVERAVPVLARNL